VPLLVRKSEVRELPQDSINRRSPAWNLVNEPETGQVELPLETLRCIGSRSASLDIGPDRRNCSTANCLQVFLQGKSLLGGQPSGRSRCRIVEAGNVVLHPCVAGGSFGWYRGFQAWWHGCFCRRRYWRFRTQWRHGRFCRRRHWRFRRRRYWFWPWYWSLTLWPCGSLGHHVPAFAASQGGGAAFGLCHL